MAGFNDDDDGFNIKMIPKPGAAAMGPAPIQDPNAVNMRPVLAQSDADKRAAQANWETTLRQNVGLPVQNASTAVADKLDSLFSQPKDPRPLPAAVVPKIDPEAMDRLRQQMLAERANNGGQISPEAMQRFQKLKAMMMNPSSGEQQTFDAKTGQPGQIIPNPTSGQHEVFDKNTGKVIPQAPIAVQPEETQED